MRHSLLFLIVVFFLFILGCNAPIQEEEKFKNKEQSIEIYNSLNIAKSLDKRWAKDDQKRLLKNRTNKEIERSKSNLTNLTVSENQGKGGAGIDGIGEKGILVELNAVEEKEFSPIKLNETNNDLNKKNNLSVKSNQKNNEALPPKRRTSLIEKTKSEKTNTLHEKTDVELPKPKKINNLALFDITSLDPSDAKRLIVGKWERIDPPNPKGDFFVGGWKKEEVHFDKNGYMTVVRFFGKNTKFRSTCDYTVHTNKKISFGQKTRPEKINKPITMYHDPEMPTLKPPTQDLPAILPFKRNNLILTIDGIQYKIKKNTLKKPTGP